MYACSSSYSFTALCVSLSLLGPELGIACLAVTLKWRGGKDIVGSLARLSSLKERTRESPRKTLGQALVRTGLLREEYRIGGQRHEKERSGRKGLPGGGGDVFRTDQADDQMDRGSGVSSILLARR